MCYRLKYVVVAPRERESQREPAVIASAAPAVFFLPCRICIPRQHCVYLLTLQQPPTYHHPYPYPPNPLILNYY
jgi:hypothetical protein